ncbi:double-strand break repair protein MRE11 [Exophiala aquamarina CBS 119918]|uniref:Double-strand break repair protein n=1 Tax=Exophiala aquamarina CBS 119918 TaxID=1182545 RepID=A0A072P2U6_9EURO|nr:double-strand break repair protein MRE11 [Exophiala aquamarina CBS 119918]KEF54022.1 double-strand break repair protein MRE11 [Exophiala aquamarina CBS 119918]
MADTISILVATDNHVGAHERDAIRGDDSWKSFHEIMCVAKERDVDMVLLAGDLFHENKPSRKSMYNVMRSLRLNCLGDKPCELEMLSDESEHFDATFDHVNYEDANINVGIPVFSIHGNHDDPTGQGHFAALDLLSVSGLINYYGKTPQSDNFSVKPVLIQKGRTKLALYGLSNVRDERLYRTFRDGNVVFHRPSTQMKDWYNLICVHQNHHAHTETSYLPENFLPDFLDLVIWGHEHECIINPQLNPEMNFQVIQPGSSVATSLIPGEAVPKHVALISITGREMHSEPIRLKTVRPFVYKDIALGADKMAVKLAEKDNHRTKLTQHLIKIVEGMIEQAKAEWLEAQDEPVEEGDEPLQCPLPLIRLRVETTSADGQSKFDVENPQRFSNRFIDKVANTSDVIQFHVRKKNASATRTSKDKGMTNEIMAKFAGLENIGVDELVKEFLEAQSLTILPQNYFDDAVRQYVVKDDKHAMELFVNEYLAIQIQNLVRLQADANDDEEDEDLASQIKEQRARLEELFGKGLLKASKARFKPKPDNWDSDLDGEWEAQPAALLRTDEDLEEMDEDGSDGRTPAPRATTTRGRGRGGRGARGRARGGATTTSGRKPTATSATKKATATASHSRRRAVPSDEEEEEEDEDIVMFDDDEVEPSEEEDSQAMFFREKRKATTKASTGTAGRSAPASTASSTRGHKAAATAAPAVRKPPTRATASRAKQSTLSFTTSQNSILGHGRGSARSARSVNDDIEDDADDDAFEPVSSVRNRR